MLFSGGAAQLFMLCYSQPLNSSSCFVIKKSFYDVLQDFCSCKLSSMEGKRNKKRKQKLKSLIIIILSNGFMQSTGEEEKGKQFHYSFPFSCSGFSWDKHEIIRAIYEAVYKKCFSFNSVNFSSFCCSRSTTSEGNVVAWQCRIDFERESSVRRWGIGSC